MSLAHGLRERGYEVQVLAPFPNRPEGKVYEGYRRTIYREDLVQGIPTIRCFSFVSRKSRLISRLAENLSFGTGAAVRLLTLKRPDLVYMNTWPLFATGLAMLVCRLKGIRVVLSIQDLYPESLESQRRIRRSVIYDMLFKLDSIICRSAALVVVISSSFRKAVLLRGVKAERVSVIPNWVKDAERLLQEPDRGDSFREQHNVGGETFLIVYAGNMGVASGLCGVVETMIRVAPAGRAMAILLAGSGSLLPDLTKVASTSREVQVIVHTPWLEGETMATLRAADVLLLSTSGTQSLFSIPSKLMYYMLAGRPVLAVAESESEIASIICASGCGWVVPPDRPEALMQCINQILMTRPEVLESMGRSGREYAMDQFCESRVVPRLIAAVEDAKGNNRTGVAE